VTKRVLRHLGTVALLLCCNVSSLLQVWSTWMRHHTLVLTLELRPAWDQVLMGLGMLTPRT
jgi:hypothetical protein